MAVIHWALAVFLSAGLLLQAPDSGLAAYVKELLDPALGL